MNDYMQAVYDSSMSRRSYSQSLNVNGGSIAFPSSYEINGSSVSYPNGSGYFNINSDAFTIEWFQYFRSGGAQTSPRVFSIGSYGPNNIAIAFAHSGTDGSRTAILIINNNQINLGAFANENTWYHFAIVGNGTTIQVYRNGQKIGGTNAYTTITSTAALTIGNETSQNFTAGYYGYIAQFRWVKGTAVYTATSFTPPTAPLTAISGTLLLLSSFDSVNVTKDYGPNNLTSTPTGISWASNAPF